MKQKILTALKTAYPKSGLSDKAFDGVASVLVKTVAEEKDIDGVVNSDETRSLIQAYQSDTDRVRTEKAQLQTAFDKYRKEHPEGNPVREPVPEPDPAIKALTDKIAALETAYREMGERAARSAKVASVREKMKAGGSDNDNILDLVLERADIKADSDAAVIADDLKGVYDATFRKFYGDGAVPQVHRNITPDDAKKADAAFAAKLRTEGKLPQEQK